MAHGSTAVTDQIVDQITDFALRLEFDDLDPGTVDRAKNLVIDAIGCGLGGSTAPPVQIARRLASSTSTGRPTTVLVSGELTTPDLAAFANGIMVRYLDYNDTFIGHGGGAHPSDLVAPALAVAEQSGANGADLIAALVVGYEVYCALGDTEPQPVSWDQSTYALVAASAVASRLLDLDEARFRHALSLTVSSHLSVGQIRAGHISHWKAGAVPNAARNAIFCSLLAAEGMTGPELVFEGSRGWRAAMGWDFHLPALGDPQAGYRLNRASTKRYPAGYFSQSAVEAALEARSSFENIDEIGSIHLETFPSGHRAMGSDPTRWRPESRETADHSMPFVIAMALMHGDVALDHYDEEWYRRPETIDLMDKVLITVGEESTRAWPGEPLNVLHIALKDGRRVSTRNGRHLGHHSRPMSDREQELKFRPMAERYAGLSGQETDRLLAELRQLEGVEDFRALLLLTVPGSGR